jgi:hypothetical protein
MKWFSVVWSLEVSMKMFQRALGIVLLLAGIALFAYTIHTKFIAPDPDDPMPRRMVVFLCLASLVLFGWGLGWLDVKPLPKPNNTDGYPGRASRSNGRGGESRESKPWQKWRE